MPGHDARMPAPKPVTAQWSHQACSLTSASQLSGLLHNVDCPVAMCANASDRKGKRPPALAAAAPTEVNMEYWLLGFLPPREFPLLNEQHRHQLRALIAPCCIGPRIGIVGGAWAHDEEIPKGEVEL